MVRLNKKAKISLIVFLISFFKVFTQVIPPGVGKANTSSWVAFGLRQELDTIEGKGWRYMTYFGIGRKSNPSNYNPIFKPAILVLNKEVYYQFNKKCQSSFALSYRKQDEYLKEEPYNHDISQYKQEFRISGGLSYIFKQNKIKLVPTLRQEFRKYYSLDFKNIEEIYQFRTRIRIQLSYTIDVKKIHQLIFSSEQLFSTSKYQLINEFGDYKYNENLLSLYYSYSPRKKFLIFNIGYMNNLVGYKKIYYVHCIAFDIIIENPFKLKTNEK